MDLANILSSKNNNKPVSLRAFVSGKADGSYTVPTIIRLKKSIIGIHSLGNGLLKFIDQSSNGIKKVISDFIKESQSDSSCGYKLDNYISLIRIYLIDPARKDNKTFTCYFIGNDIEINQEFEFTGTVVADPKTQNATAIFTSAKKVQSAIESFTVTKEIHNKLNDFCVPGNVGNVEAIMTHLEKLYRSYAGNVTNIYDRYDLHLAIDLAFHSPLSFTFDGEYFYKGWADIAIIGDTRVGKGFVAEGLQKHFGVGEVVSGDNATLTGLIGGLKSIERNWTVQWGKFPKNDGGLIILDETSKLSRQTINHLTRMRSEGIAEIHKIQSYSAPARVRTVFILNTGNGKLISQFPYGIQSILSVFKDPATVSRLDYALVVSKDEADSTVMNKARVSVPMMYDRELERQLIYWVWSRKNSEIVFSDSAVEKVYMLALDLADKYTFDVPLIQAENIRYKLAKISICFAGRVYSTKYSGRQLFVDAVHVECAWVFLNMIYKKKSSSYYALSMIKNAQTRHNEQYGIAAIEKYFASFYSKRLRLLQVLLSNQNITMTDISEQAEINKDIALEIVSRLVRNRLIERSSFTYVKTDRFTQYLRDEIAKSIGA